MAGTLSTGVGTCNGAAESGTSLTAGTVIAGILTGATGTVTAGNVVSLSAGTITGATVTGATGSCVGTLVGATITSITAGTQVVLGTLSSGTLGSTTMGAGTGTYSATGYNAIGDLQYSSTPQVIYPKTGQVYSALTSGSSVTYNQQNGQPTTSFTMVPLSAGGTISSTSNLYYTYSLSEYNVGGSTSSTDSMGFTITNSLTGSSLNSPYQLNSTQGNLKTQNVSYTPSAGSAFNVQTGFVTERGSRVASIAPSQITLNLAKNVDQLEMVVGPASGNATKKTSSKVFGPYGIGQSTNMANVTIANVTGKCSFTTTSCSVTGLANVTATPSVASAVTPVALSTATTPLAVLDSAANPASTLIVVGSKYVNSVAAQIFAQNPTLDSSFGPSSVIEQAEGSNRILVAGYYANQTVQAGNQFIEALLSSAST